MLLLNAIPLALSEILLPATTIFVGTATESSMTPVVVITPVSGSPARLFRPNRFPTTTMPLTSCGIAWLWRTKPLFPLPLALLPAKRLSYEAAPGYGAASSSPAAPLRDETLWMTLLSYTPARLG